MIKGYAGRILEAGTPREIAGSEKARQIYLGDHFQFTGRK